MNENHEIALCNVAVRRSDAFVDGPFGSNLKSEEYIDRPEIRVVQLQNIGVGWWVNKEQVFISYSKGNSLQRHVAEPGDIVIAKMAEPVARACILPPLHQRYIVVADCIKLSIDTGRFDPDFIVSVLNSYHFRGSAERVSTGTTRLRIGLSELKNLRIFAPPLIEQKKIAEVLKAVGEQIAVGQRELEKSRQIASATFVDLMNVRGCAWPEIAIADLTSKAPGSSTIGPFGSSLIASDYHSSGVPVIFVRDIKLSGFDWKSGVYVTQEKARELRAHSARPGDLVVTKMGLPPCIAAEYPSSMKPGIITADVIRVRPDVQVTTAKWLALTVNHPDFEAQVRGIAGGVTRSKVTLADFRHLKVKVPSLVEQQAIVDLMDMAREKIEVQRELLARLQMLKQALAHDLLTGRARRSVKADV